MKIIDIVDRLNRMHILIVNKKTGCPDELAKEIKISKSQVFNYLDYLRDLGVEITYNSDMRSYEYSGKYIPEFNTPIRIVQKA